MAQIVYIFVTGDDTVTRLMYPGYCLSHTQSYQPPPTQQQHYLVYYLKKQKKQSQSYPLLMIH